MQFCLVNNVACIMLYTECYTVNFQLCVEGIYASRALKKLDDTYDAGNSNIANRLRKM